MKGRVFVIPIPESLDEATRLLDWYTDNLRTSADRLVLVRLLVPDCPPPEEMEELTKIRQPLLELGAVTRDRGGSSGSSALSSTSSESAASASVSHRHEPLSVEDLMDRQLEASVALETRLVRRLRQRGLRSFRFIHAFAREFTQCLLTIAADQGASAVLAPLSAFAADHDLARTYHLYKMARIGVIHVPEF